jgi:hypothetical protein
MVGQPPVFNVIKLFKLHKNGFRVKCKKGTLVVMGCSILNNHYSVAKGPLTALLLFFLHETMPNNSSPELAQTFVKKNLDSPCRLRSLHLERQGAYRYRYSFNDDDSRKNDYIESWLRYAHVLLQMRGR